MSDDRIFAKCAWRLIPLIMLIYLVNFLDRVNVGFAALTMNRDLGFSPTVYGFGAGLFFFGYSLFQVPGNLILERIGARRWIFIIIATWGVCSAATAFVQGPTSFYAVRVLLGAAEAGFFPGFVLYLTYWFPRAYRARLVARCMSAIPLAVIFGAPLSGFILGIDGVAGLHGWQWLFLIEGAPAVILAFVVLAILPDRPAHAPWLNESEKTFIAARVAAEESTQHSDFWPAMKDLRVLALGLAYVGQQIAGFGLAFWLPQIVQGMGFSNLATGFLVAVPYLAAIVAMNLWARSSDVKGERIWHSVLPALVLMASLFVASLAPFAALVFVALVIAVMGVGSFEPPFWTLPPALLRGSARAGGIALVNTIGTGVGGFLGPAVVGALTDATGGYSAGMAALALGPMLTAIIIFALAGSLAPRKQVLEKAVGVGS